MVKELNLEPIARLVNFASAGVEPESWNWTCKSNPKVLKQAGYLLRYRFIELNKLLLHNHCGNRELDLNPDIINVNGGPLHWDIH
jgi:acetyl-CoA acyltransferase